MRTKQDSSKFKCPNCKGQKEFRVVEIVENSYITDNDDDWGSIQEINSFKTQVFCENCKREIEYDC